MLMPCQEYMRLAALSESKGQAYTYIRLNEGKVRFSKQHYDDLVREAYTTLKETLKDLGWHKLKCPVCKREPVRP
jgi:hypothetical protein